MAAFAAIAAGLLSVYYADENRLTAVDVTEAGATVRFGTPRRVMAVIVGRGFSYDVAKDGRILALTTSDQGPMTQQAVGRIVEEH